MAHTLSHQKGEVLQRFLTLTVLVSDWTSEISISIELEMAGSPGARGHCWLAAELGRGGGDGHTHTHTLGFIILVHAFLLEKNNFFFVAY